MFRFSSQTWAAAAVVAAVGLSGLDAQALETRGKIDAVTVYRGQALVTRVVEAPGPVGLQEIIITDLPEQVQVGSVYAESFGGLEIRSISFRVRPVEKDVREEVRKLDDSIRALNDKLAGLQRQGQLLGEQRAYLDKLAQFSAATATTEMSKGVLNAETIQKLTQFQFEQRASVVKAETALQLEQRNLREEIELTQRQRAQVAGGSSRTAREAVVFANVTQAQGGKLRLRYLVGNATWTPSYNVRTDAKHQGLTVEYLASVQQMSGEDWTNVTMALSTATPSLVAKAPPLSELPIALARPTGGEMVNVTLSKEEYANIQGQLKARQREFESSRNTFDQPQAGQQAMLPNAPPGKPMGANPADDNLNIVANNKQILDLIVRGDRFGRDKDGRLPAGDGEGLSVAYDLPNRTSLPSRSDNQLIQIAALPMKAEFYKLAAPVLTSYVYDEAAVTNATSTVLLAGPVATYVDNQFVGHGTMPTVTVGETFTLGLGIDSSRRAARELLEKTETTQGGNKVVEFTYRLTLENFGDAPARVRLCDRLPLAKENEIRITLANPGKELSKDPIYESTQRKKGLLRWDVEVPAQSVATKALSFDYQFRMEYDRQMVIAGPPSKPDAGMPSIRELLQQR